MCAREGEAQQHARDGMPRLCHLGLPQTGMRRVQQVDFRMRFRKASGTRIAMTGV